MTTLRMLLLWSAFSLYKGCAGPPPTRAGSGWGSKAVPPCPQVGTARPHPGFEMLPLNYQSSDSWREKVLSWLKIFRMVSNKQTAEKSHWLKKKKKHRGGANSEPRGLPPSLGISVSEGLLDQGGGASISPCPCSRGVITQPGLQRMPRAGNRPGEGSSRWKDSPGPQPKAGVGWGVGTRWDRT